MRTMMTALVLALCSPVVLTAQSASGAEPVTQQTVEFTRPNGPPIRLSLGSGTMIRLPRPAHSAFIADPGIADLNLSTPTSILLYAKKGGDTVLYVEDNEGGILLNTV